VSYSFSQYTFKEHYFQRNKETNGSKHFLEFTGGYEVNSTTVNNAFTNKLYQGGFIDNELKVGTQKRLTPKENTLGLEAKLGLQYKLALDSFNLVFSLGQNLQSGNSFTRNFYNLLFFGNAPYAGQDLDVAEVRGHVQSYRYLGIGAEKKINDYIIGGQLKLYQGRYLYDVHLERGRFLTEEDGSRITADPKLELSSLKT